MPRSDEPGGREPHPRRQAQRHQRERQDAVDREADHLRQRVLGGAGEAAGAAVDHRLLMEADPRHHAAHEAVALGHRLQRVHHAAIHQPEVARVERDRRVRHGVDQAVEDLRRPQLDRGLAFTLAAHAVDHVDAAAPAREHLQHHLGRILQVGVDQDDRLAFGVGDAGGDGHLVAEVARERHDAHARIAGLDAAQQLEGAITAAVVDEDQLEPGLAAAAEHRGEPAVGLGDDVFLVEARHHDGDQRLGAGSDVGRHVRPPCAAAAAGAAPLRSSASSTTARNRSMRA